MAQRSSALIARNEQGSSDAPYRLEKKLIQEFNNFLSLFFFIQNQKSANYFIQIELKKK